MKKLFSIILVVSLIFILLVQSVFAGGGKVRGDEGQGSVNQNGPCPFGEGNPQ